MIQYFAIKNFKSFKDLVKIDFSSISKLDTSLNNDVVLKFNESININRINFLYGKNGSGKTTILEAILIMKSIVEHSDDSYLNSIRKRIGRFNNVRLSKSSLIENVIPFKVTNIVDPTTTFSIQFFQKSINYRYTILINNQLHHISDERLEVFENFSYKTIFSKSDMIFKSLTIIELERLKTYYLNKVSVISTILDEIKISDDNFKIHLTNVRDFFSRIKIGFNSISDDKSLEKMISNTSLREKIEKSIKKFDVSIDNLFVDKSELTFDEFISSIGITLKKDDLISRYQDWYEVEKIQYVFQLYHKEHPLSYGEMSSGTKAILNRLFSLFSEKDAIWIIDDFENDLHEEATNELIKYISRNFKKQQFILVTHKLQIMDIIAVKHKPLHYFVEKDDELLSSNIINMSEYKDMRKDTRNSWESFYKKGRLAQYPDIKVNVKE